MKYSANYAANISYSSLKTASGSSFPKNPRKLCRILFKHIANPDKPGESAVLDAQPAARDSIKDIFGI